MTIDTKEKPAESAVGKGRDVQAVRHLHLLDPQSGVGTFQSFDELGKDRSLAATFHGTVRDHKPLIGRFANMFEAHSNRAGLYVTVNRTDGTGRKITNITAIRAIWREADGKDPELEAKPLPLEPGLVIESSPGHRHEYVLVEGASPADEIGQQNFAACMLCTVEDYGSDPQAKDLARVLRLAGSQHRKDPTTPHDVKIISDSGVRHTRAEIVKAFYPQHVRERGRHKPSKGGGGAAEAAGEKREDLIHQILTGKSYHGPLTVLAAMYLRSGMSPGAAVNELRALMNNSVGKDHPDKAERLRWQARYDEIPHAVGTAEGKVTNDDKTQSAVAMEDTRRRAKCGRASASIRNSRRFRCSTRKDNR
jgi:RepB DNA-primase from phage plasmid